MIRTLKKRFIFTAMIAITILLLAILGTMNIWNITSAKRQIDMTFEVLANENNMERLDIPEDSRLENPLHFEKNLFMTADYFMVMTDTDGNVINMDLSHISFISESEAENYVSEALKENDDTGKVNYFEYRQYIDEEDNTIQVFFLNTSEQINFCMRVLIFSLCIGCICWVVMLLLVVLLSSKMIAPIAENMENQKRFITNAGHEIKTPLAIILSNTDAMELYNGENKWSKNIREQVNRLNGLMRNLLLLAKREESCETRVIENVSVSDIAQETLLYYSEMMHMKEVSIQTQIEPNLFMQTDRDSLIHLLSILLDNAAKYVNKNGTFSYTVSKGPKRIIIRMANTCEVLPEGDLQHLFDRFYRGDSARTQKSGGYGIGLSMAQSIVKGLHGSIHATVENDQVIFKVVL